MVSAVSNGQRKSKSGVNESLSCMPWVVLFSSLIFLGAFFNVELLAVCLAVCVSLVFVATPGTTNQAGIVTCLWLLLLQNAMIGLGAHLGGNTSTSLSLLTQIPFLLIAALFAGRYILGKRKRAVFEAKTRWSLVLCMLIVAMFFVGGASINSQLVSIRNLTMFYMGYKLACDQCFSEVAATNALKQLVFIGIVATVFGVAMMLQDIQFWQAIGIYEAYIAKQSSIPYGTLGGRFYTSLDGVNDVLRMGSLYYEPVNLAYLLLAGLIASYYLYRKSQCNVLSVLVISIGFILTFGKGGYLLLVFLFATILTNRLIARIAGKNEADTRLVSFILCFLAVGSAAYLYYRLVGGPVKPHFWAIEQTIGSILSTPLGHGLGTGGNMSAAGGDYSKGAESAIMAFGYQIGVLGIAAVLMMLYSISRCFDKRKGLHADLGFFLPLCLFAISILQENTFSPQCIFPFMVLLAALDCFDNPEAEQPIRFRHEPQREKQDDCAAGRVARLDY